MGQIGLPRSIERLTGLISGVQRYHKCTKLTKSSFASSKQNPLHQVILSRKSDFIYAYTLCTECVFS